MNLLQDLCLVLRLLKKSPAFTIIAIRTLALGIGANSAILSVVHSDLLRSLSLSHLDKLAGVFASSTVFDFPYMGVSLPAIAYVHFTTTPFSAISVFTDSPKELSDDNHPQRLGFTAVTTLPGIGPAPSKPQAVSVSV
jgi:putative ABC transport system permease protein